MAPTGFIEKYGIILFFTFLFLYMFYIHSKHTNKNDTLQPQTVNILAFGDSLTEGSTENAFGFRAYHPYTIQLKKKLKNKFPNIIFNVDNAGIRGDQVLCNMYSRLRQALERKPYDFVIILAGTNDYINLIAKSENLKGRHRLLREGYIPAKKLIQEQIAIVEKERSNIYSHILELHEFCYGQGITTMLLTIPEINFEEHVEYSIYAKQREMLNTDLRNYQHEKKILVDLDKDFPLLKLNKNDRSKLWLSDGLHFTSAGYDKVGDLIYDKLYYRIH